MRSNGTVLIPDQVVENNRSRGRFASMQYPSEGSTHGIYMNFSEYSYSSGVIDSVKEVGSIGLPLPASITDRFGIAVGGRELGVGGALARDAVAAGSLADFVSSALSAASNLGTDAANSLRTTEGVAGLGLTDQASYISYINKSGLGSIVPGLGDAISSGSGEAVNPHQSLVFDGVDLKNFAFSWTLAPQSEAESNEIHRIIRTMKSKILPKYKAVGAGSDSSLSRGILTYPNMVDIYFVGFDPSKIFTFKRSMVKGLSVDYSPNGNVMIKGNNGSAPAFINISMEFIESEIWTADEFGG
jgi:hypothetical protein